MPQFEKDQAKNTPTDASNFPAETGETPQAQFERERLTRRQALRKFGFGAGLSAFMLLGMDDLARMVGQELEKRAGDNKVADQIAKEFQTAGFAFASGVSCCKPNYNCDCCGGSTVTGQCCSGSSDPNACCGKSYGPNSGNWNVTARQQCCTNAYPGATGDYWQQCMNACGGVA